MSNYFADKFISPHLLTFLLLFWLALLGFGLYFWEYDESGSLMGFLHFISFIVLMILITYREVQQGKKRIYDESLLSITHSSFQTNNKTLLLASDEKFLRLSNFTFWAILVLLILFAILLIYSVINGKVKYDDFIFLSLGLFLINYVYDDIKMTKQRILDKQFGI